MRTVRRFEGFAMTKYRVAAKGPQSEVFVAANSAREACEAVVKATHDGQEVIVQDEAGTRMTEEALSELVKKGE